MNFTIVIPTYKRPDALTKTVDSVLQGTSLPREILIIDDDTITSDLLALLTSKSDEKGIVLKYHKKDHSVIRRGLSESKNWSVTLTDSEIIFYLDDDVILDVYYCAEMMKVWKEHNDEEKLIGIGGRISNNRSTSKVEKLYRKLFGLNGECSWDVNEVGFQVWDEGVVETQKGYYLHGGVSSYRRELLKQFPFETFSGGRTGLEDVEHCLRAKRAGYHFYYVPSAHLVHHPAPAGREAQYISGQKEGANRREIFKRHCSQSFTSKLHFFWANVGWIGKKVLSGNWRGAWGMVLGLFSHSTT